VFRGVFLVGGIVAVASGAPEWIVYVTTSLGTVGAVFAAYRVEERGQQADDRMPGGKS
jgi:hypothetical protein